MCPRAVLRASLRVTMGGSYGGGPHMGSCVRQIAILAGWATGSRSRDDAHRALYLYIGATLSIDSLSAIRRKQVSFSVELPWFRTTTCWSPARRQVHPYLIETVNPSECTPKQLRRANLVRATALSGRGPGQHSMRTFASRSPVWCPDPCTNGIQGDGAKSNHGRTLQHAARETLDPDGPADCVRAV
jgi:hypothetical protein